ncbi:hypothetical protein Glove_674g1 [Diversispora epigaea]|uniref:Mitochondrial import receptor subunit TOM7 n=1 Tax=Diversispora epigaea TaxID=1348612 RepID=A0A397G3B0_9GLOM|nr:hypothetical protein Glove_674g1 [Diversispora epigaea]
MREETKEKIIKALEIAKTIVHWGFIPAILYLGFTRSHPKPSLISMPSSMPSGVSSCMPPSMPWLLSSLMPSRY